MGVTPRSPSSGERWVYIGHSPKVAIAIYRKISPICDNFYLLFVIKVASGFISGGFHSFSALEA